MKKSLYSLFAVLAIFCACQDENSQLGKSLVESSFYNVYADTCSVDISTILLDSIETRGDSICQLGHYRSSAWGEVSATYYAEYSTSDFTPNTDYTYTLDSLVLRMIPSGHFWGDTLTQQRISIYRLKSPIVLDNDEDLYISTILLDSIETRGDSICQLGHYRSSAWGEVSATYYAEYSTSDFTPNTDYTYTLDSLVLRMIPSGHFWGDTLTQQRISIYRLKSPIVLDNDEDLYNSTVLPTEDAPLFSFTFTPCPGRKKEVSVRLPDSWGQQLLNDLVAQDDYFDTQDKFKKKFPGLVFVPENDGQCITGFMVNDSAMSINLHYQEVSNQRTGQVLTFSVNTDYAYTGIRHDPTGTHLASLKSGIENLVHSNDMGCLAYMQGLTGYYNQLEFPYLNSLGSAGQIVSIESATLYLYPLARSYNEVSQLPNDIRLYITDENNVLEDYVYGSDGVTVQTGDLTIDEMYGKETYYSFDLTEFIRNNYGTSGIKRQKLLMSLTDEESTTTFNQVIFTNDPEQERQCRLDVRFKIYNEQ